MNSCKKEQIFWSKRGLDTLKQGLLKDYKEDFKEKKAVKKQKEILNR